MNELDYIKGVMTASAALITIAGILFAFGFKKRIDELKGFWEPFCCTSLLASIFLGAGTLIFSLSWLKSSNTNASAGAFWFLVLQSVTLYVPIAYLIIKIGLNINKPN